MSIIEQDSQPFEPYARLMNIIGDQLITDKKVAVVEIVKNSYDADADNVQVRFFNIENYGKNYLPVNEQPYIEIEDDGDGMTLDIIKNVWLRPATPNKLSKKKGNENRTRRGRIIQGEKGIGRFAIHKLGEKIELYTKSLKNQEVKLEMDFTEFDPEKTDLFNQPTDYKLLNKVFNNWFLNDPPLEIKKPKGTLIRIYNLREQWKNDDLKELYKSVQRLIPPLDENSKMLGIDFKQDFNIELYLNGEISVNTSAVTFRDVIERAQYTMIGSVSSGGILDFRYKATSPLRIVERTLDLTDKEKLSEYNYTSYALSRGFHEEKGNKDINKNKDRREPVCGAFVFTFYAFDLSKPDKTILNKDLKEFIKDNFVFVLRDGVRVYPYGERGIDWLNLDKLRSTIRAGQFISYNDLTGFVYISQEGNPLLKDSSNRQGIMDIDGALEDFKNLITGVTEIFNTEIKIDKTKVELQKKVALNDSNEIVLKSFNSFKNILEKIDNRDVLEKANSFLSTVTRHTNLMRDRMETVEDLAGLGMAVEKASHDSLTILSTMRGNINDFKVRVRKNSYTDDQLLFLLDELDDNLNFVYDEMQIIQPLFKAQRKAIQDISLKDSIDKVIKYFRREIENKIRINIDIDSDIIINTNRGLILQILINLIDNSVYWVNQNNNIEKEISIKFNADEKSFIIADNGPGIREDIVPIIFNEFFSLKTEGRGLGLYIVKEILFRINSEISVITFDTDKILPGANFLIKFNKV